MFFSHSRPQSSTDFRLHGNTNSAVHRALRSITVLVTLLIAGALLSGCSISAPNSTSSSNASTRDSSKPLKIFATTGQLGDAVKNIAPDAELTIMVKPGGDPHTYQPSTQDFEALGKADVILWNGLHLEARMIKQIESFGSKQLALGDSVDENLLLDWPEKDDTGQKLHDPHIWNSPVAWQQVVKHTADFIAKADPANRDMYLNNAQAYIEKIKQLDSKIHSLLDPIKNRILVTGHDAFGYLGKTYNLEVTATDFVSTEAEKSAKELEDLADYIAKNKVRTIFVDNTQNPQGVKSLQENVARKGGKTSISPYTLYADTLGDKDPVNTYLGAMIHNAQAIAEGLS